MTVRNIEIPQYEVHERISINPANTALIIVDMQNDFCHPDGSLFVPEAPKTVEAIAYLLDQARRHKMPVIYTQDWHETVDPEFDIWGGHAVGDTWGAKFIDALKPRDGEHIIRKIRYDAFYGTHLDHLLRLHGIETLIICGTMANVCVHYTAASAALRWYNVIVPADGISALTPFDTIATCHQVTSLFRGRIAKARGIEVEKQD